MFLGEEYNNKMLQAIFIYIGEERSGQVVKLSYRLLSPDV